MCKLYWQEDSFKRNSRTHFVNFVWRDFLVNKNRTEHDNLYDTLNCISGHPANFATCIAWIRKQFCLIRTHSHLGKCVMCWYLYIWCTCVLLHTLVTQAHPQTVCFSYEKNTVRLKWLWANHCWNIHFWDCSVYCRASIISGFCLLNGNYCGNQKYTHKFPKCLFRKSITPVENSCSEKWQRTPTRSIGVLPRGLSNWCRPTWDGLWKLSVGTLGYMETVGLQ